jgi:hypothetical protein
MKMETLDKTLSNMNGRYFGIEKKDGNKINARLRKTTPKSVVVEDRNAGKDVKLMKDSIASITIAGETLR